MEGVTKLTIRKHTNKKPWYIVNMEKSLNEKQTLKLETVTANFRYNLMKEMKASSSKHIAFNVMLSNGSIRQLNKVETSVPVKLV